MRVFWDTNLFIYLWESKRHSLEIDALCGRIEAGGHTVATSTLTVGEILVHPIRLGREDLVVAYRQAFSDLEIIPFDFEGSTRFGQLRAANASLRPLDGIQLACAIVGGCDVFLTNDERLSRVAGAGSLAVASMTRWRDVL